MKEQAKKELHNLNERNGILKARDVVDYARNRKTALHDYFEWNNRKAGEAHRLQQARMLINVYVEMIPNVAKPVKVFVSLRSDRRQPGGGYREMEAVIKSKSLRDELLEQALSELISMQQKYRLINEIVVALQPAIDKISQAKKGRRRKVG